MIKHLIAAALVGTAVWLGLPILEQYVKIPDPEARFKDFGDLLNAKYLPIGGGAALIWLMFLKSLIKGIVMIAMLIGILGVGAYLVFVGV